MDGILIRKISTKEELVGHSCGVDSVDRMIAESFMPHILRQQDTYKIMYKNTILGFYAIQIKAAECWDSDAEFAEYYDCEPAFGAVYVKYLGVDSPFQYCGVGSCALRYIVRTAQEESEKLPIRLIIFKALRDKVQYYLKRGFLILNQEEYNGDSETVDMYFDLMPDEEFERTKALLEY